MKLVREEIMIEGADILGRESERERELGNRGGSQV